MINVLFTLLIVALVCGAIYWASDVIPITGPFNRIIKGIAIIAFVIIAIVLLARVLGVGMVSI